MTKSKGGDPNLMNLSTPSELQKFVTEIITTQAGGAKMNKKTGGMELSPFIVSILTLGMRVASDPKLSKMFDKHRKLHGGSENVATEMYNTLVSNTEMSGGKTKSKKRGGDYASFDMEEVPVTKGGKSKSKKRGGYDYVGTEKVEEVPVTEGGKAKTKVTKSKKHGGQEMGMKMFDSIEKSFSGLIGGKKKNTNRGKKSGGSDVENLAGQDTTPVSDPSAETVTEMPDMTSVAAEAADLQPVPEMSTDVSDLPEMSSEVQDVTTGGAKKRKTKTPAKKGGNKQLIDMMVVPESMPSPMKGAGKKMKSKRVVSRKKGGSDTDYLLD
jgi:hypothetical protein